VELYLKGIEGHGETKDVGHEPILGEGVVGIHYDPKTTIQNMSRREIERSNFYPEHQNSNPRVEGTLSTLLDDNMIPMNRLAQPPRNPPIPRRPDLKVSFP
jgi:hypothetical protein